jgi:hypothetical protein
MVIIKAVVNGYKIAENEKQLQKAIENMQRLKNEGIEWVHQDFLEFKPEAKADGKKAEKVAKEAAKDGAKK